MYSKLLKRVAISVSIMLLTVVLLSGCINSSKPASNSQAKSDVSESHDGKFDLKGKKVTIAVPNESFIPSEESKVSVNIIMNKRKQEIESRYNCVIEWVPGEIRGTTSYYNKVVETIKSGQYFSDIIYINTSIVFPEWVNKKVILPLDEYIDYNSGLFNNSLQYNLMWEGEHYGITNGALSPMRLSYITYNKDIFSDVGLPDPYDLMVNGQWTWDAFLDSAVKTTIDKNGDGATDQWGLEAAYDELTKAFIISNGAGYVKKQDGRYINGLTDIKAIEAVKFISTLYNDYRVVVDPYLSKGTMSEDYTNKRAAMFNGIGPDSKNSGINSGLVMFPKTTDELDYSSIGGNLYFYAMPSNCSNPKAISKILSDLVCVWDTSKKDFIAPDKMFSNITTSATESAVWYMKGNNLEILKYAYNKMKLYPFENNYSFKIVIDSALRNIVRYGEPVEDELNKINEKMQQLIDSIANSD